MKIPPRKKQKTPSKPARLHHEGSLDEQVQDPQDHQGSDAGHRLRLGPPNIGGCPSKSTYPVGCRKPQEGFLLFLNNGLTVLEQEWLVAIALFQLAAPTIPCLNMFSPALECAMLFICLKGFALKKKLPTRRVALLPHGPRFLFVASTLWFAYLDACCQGTLGV